MNQNVRSIRDKVGDLSRQLEQKIQLTQRLESDIEEYDKEIRKLEEENDQLLDTLNNSKTVVMQTQAFSKDISHENESLRSEIEECNRRFSSEKAAFEKQRKELVDLQLALNSERVEMEEELRKKDNEIQSIKSEIQEYSRSLDQARASIDSLRSDSQTAKQMAGRYRNHVVEHEKTISKLMEELEACTSQHDDEKIEQVKESIQAIESTLDTLDNFVGQPNYRKSTARKTISMLKTKYSGILNNNLDSLMDDVPSPESSGPSWPQRLDAIKMRLDKYTATTG